MSIDIEDFFRYCATQELHVRKVKKENNEFQNQTESLHMEINQTWARPVLNPCTEKIQAIPVEVHNKADHSQIFNEINTNDMEIQRFDGRIEREMIAQFLSLPPRNDVGEIPPVLSVDSPVSFFDYKANFPEPADFTIQPVISIGVSSIFPKDALPNDNFHGYIQLYNITKLKPKCEPIYFAASQNNFKFLQTPRDNIYLPIRHPSESIVLVCVLFKTILSEIEPFGVTYQTIFSPEKEFLPFLQFEPRWPICKPEGIRHTLRAIKDGESMESITINSALFIKFFDHGEGHYSYTWSDNRDDMALIATPLRLHSYDPTPVITIHDLEFTLNAPPSNCKLTFKAYVFHEAVPTFVKEYTSIASEQLLGNVSLFKKIEYTSTLFPALAQVSVDDCIRIYVNEKINPNTHVVLQIEGHSLTSSQVSVYKIGIIPLFNPNGETQDQDKFILYDAKSIPKDYLKKPKKPGKTFFSCKIEMPAIYFPTIKNLNKIVNARSADQLVLPEEDIHLIDHIIPITAKYLTYITPQTMSLMLEFFSYFPAQKVSKTLRPWIYNTLSPRSIGLKFVFDLTNALATLIPEVLTGSKLPKPDPKKRPDNKSISDLLKIQHDEKIVASFIDNLPLIFDILLVAMVITENEYSFDQIYPFFEYIIVFIEESLNYRDIEATKAIVVAYSQFLYSVITSVPFVYINKLMFKIIYSLSIMKQAAIENPELQEELTYIQFLFLAPFSRSSCFIIGCASLTRELNIKVTYSPFNPLLSQIFLATSQAFTSNDPKVINICCQFISGLSIFENFPNDIAAKVSFSLFPLVHLISSDFDSKVFKENPEAQIAIIPLVLLLLNKSSHTQLKGFFSALASSFKQQFVAFLDSMVEKVKDDSQIQKYLGFYIQMTARVIQFLLVNINDLESGIEKVIHLLTTLLCEHQSEINFPIIYNFTSLIIKNYTCQRALIVTLLHLIKRRMHSTRCLATALLSLQFYADYNQNKSVVLSSIETMDALTAILLGTEMFDITKIVDIYTLLIERINELANAYQNNDFTSRVSERMQATKVITNIIKDQKLSTYPIEIKSHQAMQIADQYMLYPTMRKKWLNEILTLNLSGNDKVSAFMTQMHIVALCTTVYEFNREKNIRYIREMGKEDPPCHLCIVQPLKFAYPKYIYPHKQVYLDFQYLPEVLSETDIHFNEMEFVAQGLLNEFTFEDLVKQLNRAVEIGMEAQMFYSLRPLYSLELRLHHLSRNSNESAEVCKNMSELFDKIKTEEATFTHDNYLAFYLVEFRSFNNYQMEIKRQVYCVNRPAADDKFVEEISCTERFGSLMSKLCTNHHGNCQQPGVCIVKLEPIDDGIEKGEHKHCWSEFRSSINLKQFAEEAQKSGTPNVIPYIYIKTRNPVPHYRMATDVQDYEIRTSPLLDALQTHVDRGLKILKHVGDEIALWFEMEHNTDYSRSPKDLVGGEIGRIPKILEVQLHSAQAPGFLLPYIKDTYPEQTTEMATNFRKSIDDIMKIFRRAAKEVERMSPHGDDGSGIVLPSIGIRTMEVLKYQQLANKFCADFGLPDLSETEEYVGREDPMLIKLPYE